MLNVKILYSMYIYTYNALFTVYIRILYMHIAKADALVLFRGENTFGIT